MPTTVFDAMTAQHEAEFAERALIDAQRRWMIVEFYSTRGDHGANVIDLADIFSGKARLTNWPADGFISSGLHYDVARDGFLLRIASASFDRVPVGAPIPTLGLVLHREG